MSGIIDADTHIAESESMWELIDESMRQRRPVLLTARATHCTAISMSSG